jgi:hypothetical protein
VTFQGAWVGGVVLMSGGVFKRMSEILFGNMVWLSIRWLLEVYSLYIHTSKQLQSHEHRPYQDLSDSDQENN